MSSHQTTDESIGQQNDFYDDYDYEDKMSVSAEAPDGQPPLIIDEDKDAENWTDYQVGDEGNDHIFPIGYTIQFSPPPDQDERSRSRSRSDAPRGGLGSQALPVPTDIRPDWDGTPQDGAEQEARNRPRVVAKENPYAFKPPSRPRRSATPSSLPSSSSNPDPTWRAQFRLRFANMRKSLQEQEPLNWVVDDAYHQTPPANDESNWKIFIFGKKVSSGCTDQLVNNNLGRKQPTAMFLKALDQLTVIGILSHYTGWIDERLNSLICLIEQHTESPSSELEGAVPVTNPLEITLLSAHDGSWLLGLLSILDSVLTSEDVYKLRALARVCKRVAQIADVSSKQADSIEDTSHQEAATGWMVVAAIADVWGQKDLWDD